MKMDSLVTVAEGNIKLLAILDNVSHPLHTFISNQRSSFSDRMLLTECNTNRLKKSFVPQAIKLYSPSLGGRGREPGLNHHPLRNTISHTHNSAV